MRNILLLALLLLFSFAHSQENPTSQYPPNDYGRLLHDSEILLAEDEGVRLTYVSRIQRDAYSRGKFMVILKVTNTNDYPIELLGPVPILNLRRLFKNKSSIISKAKAHEGSYKMYPRSSKVTIRYYTSDFPLEFVDSNMPTLYTKKATISTDDDVAGKEAEIKKILKTDKETNPENDYDN